MKSPSIKGFLQSPYGQAVIFTIILFGAAWITNYRKDLIAEGKIVSDGAVYFNMLREMPEALFDKYDTYVFSKILVILILHYLFEFFNILKTSDNVITAFTIMNFILMACSSFIWANICKRNVISPRISFISFAFLYINFFSLKFIFYYPVLVDVPSFFLGMLILYGVVSAKTWVVAVATLCGAFVRPSLKYIGLGALILGRETEYKLPAQSNYESNVSRFSWPAAFAVAVLFVGYANYWWYGRAIREIEGGGASESLWPVILNKIEHSPHITILVTLIFVYFGLKPLLPRPDIMATLRTIKVKNLVWAVAVYALIWLILRNFATSADAYSAFGHFTQLIFLSVKDPFRFIVTHVYYFGPVILFAIVLWPKICAEARSYQATGVFFLGLLFINGLHPESRLSLDLFPFLVFFVTLAAERHLNISRSFTVKEKTIAALLLAFSIFISKVWDKININNDAYWFAGVGGRISGEIYDIHRWWVLGGLTLTFLIVKSFRKDAHGNETGGP